MSLHSYSSGSYKQALAVSREEETRAEGGRAKETALDAIQSSVGVSVAISLREMVQDSTQNATQNSSRVSRAVSTGEMDDSSLAFTGLLQAITGSRRNIGLKRRPLRISEQMHFIKEASILYDSLTRREQDEPELFVSQFSKYPPLNT
ncbi:uncharacterized protein FA14DRAFT_176837 [Meira miltonrushii]|uniref:Uncharacterized protein n=1 Tax=Meira miltonrushii TaxID=1280837 RepID=A0A316VIQ8_9BASI|nr:uncharacterized protein FA14DRAFT_176837 [Meira miltonrushii]PWN37547.1 hypothetical protein FA14DRAFT_176837 [Meira miltonrushii]